MEPAPSEGRASGPSDRKAAGALRLSFSFKRLLNCKHEPRRSAQRRYANSSRLSCFLPSPRTCARSYCACLQNPALFRATKNFCQPESHLGRDAALCVNEFGKCVPRDAKRSGGTDFSLEIIRVLHGSQNLQPSGGSPKSAEIDRITLGEREPINCEGPSTISATTPPSASTRGETLHPICETFVPFAWLFQESDGHPSLLRNPSFENS